MGNINKSDKEKLFTTQVGQSATIQRETVKSDKAITQNKKLLELGAEMNPVPGSLRYMGSAAVHVFWNETLQQVFLISQTDAFRMQKCPEVLAQAALSDLMGAAMETYGHKRPKKRSGF